MTLTRLHDWQERLAAFIAERRELPFAWGPADCGHFAAGAIEAMTGVDVLAPALPKWSNRREAVRAMRTLGNSMREVTTAVLGEPVAPAFAAIGDIGLADGPSALLVCNGGTWLGVGRERVETVSAERVVCAWKVG